MIWTVRWMVAREHPGVQGAVMKQVITWFAIGGALGGAAFGAFITIAGSALQQEVSLAPEILVVGSAVVALAYGGSILGIWRPPPRPQSRYQVPEGWRDIFPTRVAAFIYSFALGIGAFTRINSAAWYVLAILGLGSGASGVMIYAFGLAGLLKGVTAMAVPYFSWHTVEDSEVIAGALDASNRHVAALEAPSLIGAAALILTGLVV